MKSIHPNLPPKLAKGVIGRKLYVLKIILYILFTSLLMMLRHQEQRYTQLSLVCFLKRSNICNIRRDGVKRLGRNRISVEFMSHQDANSFLMNSLVPQNDYVASIPQFNVFTYGYC